MLTTKQIAAKWGISAVRVRQFILLDRIPGAVKVGRDWLIPATATFPTYHRVWNKKTT